VFTSGKRLITKGDSNMRFKDKVVIVTGSSRGLGKGIALGFAREGANLVLVARSIEQSSTPKEINALGRQVLAVKTDVSVQSEVEEMVKKTIDMFGRIDVLVNDAWWMEYKPEPLDDMSPESVEAQSKCFKGYINCIRAVLPQMRLQKSGNIINITSIGGKMKNPMWPVYGAFKAGIAHLTRAIADVVAPDGIRMNCVGPGLTAAGATYRVFEKDAVDAMGGMIPLGRLGNEQDVANACIFLASDEASFITGKELTVDGGQGPY
jgi:NAD(P)-dependent dehydrogenase (short-subunit alcohol dehydrogenase family)